MPREFDERPDDLIPLEEEPDPIKKWEDGEEDDPLEGIPEIESDTEDDDEALF